MAAAAPLFTIAGFSVTPLTILGAVSGLAGAAAIDAETEMNVRRQQAAAQAAEYNQTIARQNADLVRQQTQADVERQDRERRLRLGAARAGAGASGVGAESFGDILQSSAAQEELDLLTIQSEGMLRQREFTTQADLFGMEASSARAQIPLIKSSGSASKAANTLSGISGGLGNFSGGSGGTETIRWNQGGTSTVRGTGVRF